MRSFLYAIVFAPEIQNCEKEAINKRMMMRMIAWRRVILFCRNPCEVPSMDEQKEIEE